MLDRLMSYVSGSESNSSNSNDVLWKLCRDLWLKGESKTELCRKAQKYWEGELDQSLPANIYFPQQNHTNCNIIKPIIETKLKNMLDAQFTLAVMPDVGVFYDYTAMKEAQTIADIFNEELLNIFKRNNLDALQEKLGRQAFLCGYGASKTTWDDKERHDGDIKIEWIKSEMLRWSKGADCVRESSYMAYLIEKSPAEIKELFAKNPDGSYNQDLCKEIDEISQVEIGDQGRKQSNSVVNYIYSTTGLTTAGRAFAEGISGIQGGKKVQLVCMYMLDDSMYAPETKDDAEQEAAKLEYTKLFPNGRLVVFSLDEKKKMILVDEPAPEEF
jgi:hypothetical protein